MEISHLGAVVIYRSPCKEMKTWDLLGMVCFAQLWRGKGRVKEVWLETILSSIVCYKVLLDQFCCDALKKLVLYWEEELLVLTE